MKFLGHVFDKNGQNVDEDKVKAIINLSTPRNIQDLQRFLGMLNFLNTFIDNLASQKSKKK